MSWLAVTFTTQEINSLIRWLAGNQRLVKELRSWGSGHGLGSDSDDQLKTFPAHGPEPEPRCGSQDLSVLAVGHGHRPGGR